MFSSLLLIMDCLFLILISGNESAYEDLARQDILKSNSKKNENRLTGAAIFPTDLDLVQNSQVN